MSLQRSTESVAWRLEAEGYAAVITTLPAHQAADLVEVARLQSRTPAAVLTHVLDIGIHGRLKLGRLRRGSAAGSLPTSTAGGAISVEPEFILHIQQLAAARRCSPDRYCALLVSEHLYGPDPSLAPNWQADVFNVRDGQLTTWLPAALRAALSALAVTLEISASDLARSSVFSHLHGRLGYERALLAGSWKPSVRYVGNDCSEPPEDAASTAPGKAPSTALMEQIGTSELPFTLHMPQALIAQLRTTAERAGMPASEYLRRHLATYLLGRLEADALPLG